jgi:hypothetical protein
MLLLSILAHAWVCSPCRLFAYDSVQHASFRVSCCRRRRLWLLCSFVCSCVLQCALRRRWNRGDDAAARLCVLFCVLCFAELLLLLAGYDACGRSGLAAIAAIDVLSRLPGSLRVCDRLCVLALPDLSALRSRATMLQGLLTTRLVTPTNVIKAIGNQTVRRHCSQSLALSSPNCGCVRIVLAS